MNIAKAFTNYMQNVLSLGTFGTDIFIGGAPQESPNKCWWVVSAGGANDVKNISGERRKKYTLSIYYRNTDEQDVYEQMQALEEEINAPQCIQLEQYVTIEIQAISFPADQDLDDSDRTIGLMQVEIEVYQSV